MQRTHIQHPAMMFLVRRLSGVTNFPQSQFFKPFVLEEARDVEVDDQSMDTIPGIFDL